jgi:hypothetical protein
MSYRMSYYLPCPRCGGWLRSTGANPSPPWVCGCGFVLATGGWRCDHPRDDGKRGACQRKAAAFLDGEHPRCAAHMTEEEQARAVPVIPRQLPPRLAGGVRATGRPSTLSGGKGRIIRKGEFGGQHCD